jgi:hypothetical protein
MVTAIIPFNKTLKEKREQLGISWDRAATMLCLSDMEYFDLELHEDEWRDVVPAYVIGFAISIFEIDWRNSYNWPKGGAIQATLPLNEFLVSIRQTHGLTPEQFSDRIGYSEPFANVIESHSGGLALWPMDVAIDLALAFDVNLISLAECVLQPHVVYARIAAGRRGG